MAALKNDFRWSFTRQQMFTTCRRQYYYQYYGKWPGWEWDAPAEVQLAYRLSKIRNLPMMAGSIVHDVIEAALKGVQQGWSLPTLEELQTRAVNRLKIAWQQSRDRCWLTNPKDYANLLEHYYGRHVPKEERQRIKQRVLDSLAHFYSSATLAQIMATGPSNWKEIEQFQTFAVESVTVGLKIDFAADIDGWLEIYDWKTGKEDEAHADQLRCYALYGEQKWGYNLDRIGVNVFYLDEDVIHRSGVTSEQRAEIIGRIIEGSATMWSLLTDRARNIATIDSFAMSADMRVCRQCRFQELCHGGAVDAAEQSGVAS